VNKRTQLEFPSASMLPLVIGLSLLCFHNVQASEGQFPAADPVQVKVFYEPFCEGCAHIFKLLTKLVTILGHTGSFELELIPFGNSHFTEYDDGQYNITCESGSGLGLECDDIYVEACLINTLSELSIDPFYTISCIETAGKKSLGDSIFLGNCLIDRTLTFYEKFYRCEQAETDEKLEQLEALERVTKHANLAGEFPMITIGNNVTPVTSCAQLINTICDTYQGTTPSYCEYWDKLFFVESTPHSHFWDVNDIHDGARFGGMGNLCED